MKSGEIIKCHFTHIGEHLIHPEAVLVGGGKEAVPKVSHVINPVLEGLVAVLKTVQSHLKVEHPVIMVANVVSLPVRFPIGTWPRRIPTKS